MRFCLFCGGRRLMGNVCDAFWPIAKRHMAQQPAVNVSIRPFERLNAAGRPVLGSGVCFRISPTSPLHDLFDFYASTRDIPLALLHFRSLSDREEVRGDQTPAGLGLEAGGQGVCAGGRRCIGLVAVVRRHSASRGRRLMCVARESRRLMCVRARSAAVESAARSGQQPSPSRGRRVPRTARRGREVAEREAERAARRLSRKWGGKRTEE